MGEKNDIFKNEIIIVRYISLWQIRVITWIILYLMKYDKIIRLHSVAIRFYSKWRKDSNSDTAGFCLAQKRKQALGFNFFFFMWWKLD